MFQCASFNVWVEVFVVEPWIAAAVGAAAGAAAVAAAVSVMCSGANYQENKL